MIFSCYKNYLYTHRYKLSSEKKKNKQVKSIGYSLSLPETGSDPPIGSDWESGCDNLVHPWIVRTFHSLPFDMHICIHLSSLFDPNANFIIKAT